MHTNLPHVLTDPATADDVNHAGNPRDVAL